jgi:hypothetical protein
MKRVKTSLGFQLLQVSKMSWDVYYNQKYLGTFDGTEKQIRDLTVLMIPRTR